MPPDELYQCLRNVVGDGDFVPLHEPMLGGRAWDYVRECLDTGWVSTAGKFVDRFEADLADFTGVRHAVAVVNGTAALQLALQLVGVTDGDEVLCPALTFVATANAISYGRAVPHFVDINEATLGVDPGKLDDYLNDVVTLDGGVARNRHTGRVLRAIVPMHTFGHPVDMDPLLEVADRYRLQVVEDAAESLGSWYKGRHTGGFGRAAAVSFNGNKIATTGGGGAILTNDSTLAATAKHLSTTAKASHRWEYDHDQLGYNYRLPNLNAALGCAQLEALPPMIEQKRALAERYQQAFREIPGARVFCEPEFAHSNYWLNVLLLDDELAKDRDSILETTNGQGVMTRPVWRLLSELPMYARCPTMELTTSQSIQRRAINIPSSAILGAEPVQQSQPAA